MEKFSVVIVDDDPGIRFLHEITLEESGFSQDVIKLKNAEEALEFFSAETKNSNFYILFLDINLKDMNGWDLLNELEKLKIEKRIYVVMVTSSLDDADYEKSKTKSLIIDFVEKPLSTEICEQLKEHEKLTRFFSK